MRRFLYLVFFILAANACSGTGINLQVKKHIKAILKTDSSRVTARSFDKSSLKALAGKPEFRYKEEPTPDLSWWTRFWRWFWQWIGHLFSLGAKHPNAWSLLWGILKILLLLSGVAALVFVIFKSQGIHVLGIFRRKPAAAPVPYFEFLEDINEIDFDAEIENAIARHNYRFAVRLLYLKSLKKLSDSGLIEWQIDKTNSTYISELSDQGQREAFRLLTRQFEYIWYGEFIINGQVYQNVNSSFQDFNKQVA